MSCYRNPWIPAEAVRMLDGEQGTILDVGGGAAPYCRASHIVDTLAFEANRLEANAWGNGTAGQWSEAQYTRLDLCKGSPWPFRDKQFDLGLCSHTLEDLRDPLPAVRELCRVSRRVLIITPSRLAEQTMGLEHPRYCGFHHHPWIVHARGDELVFRRKTPLVLLLGCHVRCPLGRRMRVESGAAMFVGAHFEPVEEAFFDEAADRDDYRRFIAAQGDVRALFEAAPGRNGWRHWVWRMRQKWLGHV